MPDQPPTESDAAERFAVAVLEAVEYYRLSHHWHPGEIQVSPMDWGRLNDLAKIPPHRRRDRGLLWGRNTLSCPWITEGRVRLLVNSTERPV